MNLPRTSQIPAGAITDPRLEGRDLQVLCLIGCFNEERGWWYASHLEMAKMLHCSRSTVQRSLGRLIDAAWVESKTTEIVYGNRRYASYAYRTILDTPHPNSEPSMCQVAAQLRDDGAHRRAPDCGEVPTGEHGAQIRGHGAQPYVGRLKDSDSKKESDDDDTRARETLVSGEAIDLTAEIMVIAGIDPKSPPHGWYGAHDRVQAFLTDGYTPEQLRLGARECMARKPSAGPPNSINYFQKPWEAARIRAESPVPRSDVSRQTANGGRYDRRTETADALDSLKEFARSGPNGTAQGGGTGGASIGRVPPPELD